MFRSSTLTDRWHFRKAVFPHKTLCYGAHAPREVQWEALLHIHGG